MSRYSGNDEECEHCGLVYKRFRTGFCYYDVWLMCGYNAPDTDSSEWKYKTRGVVLGKWFEIKQSMWEEHQLECELAASAASEKGTV